jgi:hypothetical protein
MKIFRTILLIAAIYAFYRSYRSTQAWAWYYNEKPTQCTLIDKSIRAYNEGSSKYVDLKYRNILTCRYKGHAFDVNVDKTLYYNVKIGQPIGLELSMEDIYGNQQDDITGGWIFLGIVLLIIFALSFLES